MKKKIIMGIFLVILLIFNLCSVEAYSGEIDPKNYITLPYIINITNGKGVGTITLSSSASDYNLSYQKKDISESTFTSIAAKNKEIETYCETVNKEKKEKEENLKTLQTEYTNLVNSGTATEEEIKVAKDKYDEAYAEYKQYVDTSNEKLQKLKSELYALVPDYTNEWTKTTNISNNVQLDFTNYSGKIYFVLWAKIENGVDTYYDCMVYSNEIVKNDTENSQVEVWNNAKISVKANTNSSYQLNISNIKVEDGHTYRFFVGDKNAKPEYSDDLPSLGVDKNNNILYDTSASYYLELAADQYLYVYDRYKENGEYINKIVLNGVKIEKPEQKKYTDVFWNTMIGNDRTQISFNTPWGLKTNRNIHLRIGKISDDSILKNIYNKKSNCFDDLLTYAKKSQAFYDKTVKSTENTGYEYNGELFEAKNLSDGEYYFLYALVEDENGKYVKTEGVTFARCTKLSRGWSLFFYGDDNFSWKQFSSNVESTNNVTNTNNTNITKNDTTTAPVKLPFAGLNNIIIIIAVVTAIVGIIARIMDKRYNF